MKKKNGSFNLFGFLNGEFQNIPIFILWFISVVKTHPNYTFILLKIIHFLVRNILYFEYIVIERMTIN